MNEPKPPLPPEDLRHVMDVVGGDWEQLRGRRIFLTGGTGFFGLWLLESFSLANERLALGAQAVVLTRDPEAFLRKAPHLAGKAALQFHRGDVCDFAFPEGSFDFVIHAATEASARLIAEQPLHMLRVIVDGTRRVLDFAAAAGVKKFLFTSSGAVYGKQPSALTHVPEDYPGAPDPLDAASVYGEGKRLAEHVCVLLGRRHGFEVKVARCFAFVGPHLPLDAHFAVGNFIRDGLAGEPIRVGGDGTPHRSYLYASDLASWLWVALFRAPAGRAYNVGSDVSLSIAEVAATVAGVLGNRSDVRVAVAPRAGAAVSRYVPAVERARVELALDVRIPLAMAVEKTVAWHRQGRN